MQLTHYNSKFKPQQFPITLVCDTITYAPNIGSIFRVSDAFGVEQIVFCGISEPMGRGIKKTSRATEKYVNYDLREDTLATVKSLKEQGYKIIALEITTHSKPLSTLKIPTKQPLALVIGNENFGILEDVLNICDTCVHIEMFGQNSSMNVVQATSIALYHLTNQLNA